MSCKVTTIFYYQIEIVFFNVISPNFCSAGLRLILLESELY